MMGRTRAYSCSRFFLAVLLFTSPSLAQVPEPEYPAASPKVDIFFLTGRESGNYFSLGRSISELVNRQAKGVQVMVQSSIGSLENAAQLDANKADMALIQSDIAYSLFAGTRFFSIPSSRIKVICPTHYEVVHLVTRRSKHISSVDDLEAQTVSVGDRGSGAEVNANMVLASASMTYSNITPIYANLESSIDLLKTGKIDAFFATTRCPSVQLGALLQDPEYVVVGLAPEEIGRITKGYPNTFEFVIERGTYPNQLERVPTIHVWALLVVHSEVRDAKVYQLTKTIFENKALLKKRHPFLDLDEKNASANFRIPLHPGARRYFIEAGVLRGQSLFVFLGAVLFVIAAGGILLRFFLRPPKGLRRYAKNFYFRYAAFFLSFLLVASYGMHLSERAINPNFVNFGRSIWSCLVYLFSGFGDRAPVTPLGRILSILIFLMGLSVVGIISGRFASYFIGKTIGKEKKMPAKMCDHIVICHWNAKAEKVVDELFRSEQDTKVDVQVVALTEARDASIERYELKYADFSMITGDPVLHECLRSVHVHKAKSVIIMAKEGCPDPDAQTALVALAINQVCKTAADAQKASPRFPHIVADVVNHRKTQHLKDTNVKEIVCPTDYGIGLLAQSAVNPGLVQIYDHLLRFKPEGNEIYLLDSGDLPASLSPGKAHFNDISAWLEERSRTTENPIILLGYLRQGEPILNPLKDAAVLAENDRLIVLSYCCPCLSALSAGG